MKPAERVGTVLMGGIPDRVPALPVITSAARRITGVSFAEWAQDGELHARCQLQAQELLNLEGMDVFVDLSVEAGDLGQEIVFPAEDTPHPNYEKSCIKTPDDYLAIPRIDPNKSPRMKEVIKCCEVLMNERGSTIPVLGFVFGPLGVLSMMRGVEKLFMDCLKYREQVIKGCALVTEVLVDYVKAQMKTGVPGIVVDTLFASSGIMSQKLWKEVEGPFAAILADAIRQSGGAVVIHNCGNGPYFDAQIEAMNPVAMSFAHVPIECQDMKEVKEKYGHKLTLVGYVDPARYMFFGSPEEVKAECKRQIEELAAGGRFMLSTGCEFPSNGSFLNAVAMLEAAKLYGTYQ